VRLFLQFLSLSVKYKSRQNLMLQNLTQSLNAMEIQNTQIKVKGQREKKYTKQFILFPPTNHEYSSPLALPRDFSIITHIAICSRRYPRDFSMLNHNYKRLLCSRIIPKDFFAQAPLQETSLFLNTPA
jgi:hypothetical protein